ncbi:MAG: DNA-binding protein YbiB [Rhodocyclaceae bacterium]|nr:DNA-binding protein YbiB [Rhodocyclaceae bacterium]
MTYAHIIKEIGRGAEGSRDLTEDDAARLYGAMLDGGVPDLEMGAILIALRMKSESIDEMTGFLAAANERINALHNPNEGVRPVVIPSYNGARKGANLTPLLAMLLQGFNIPVVVHGLLEGYGRITSGHIFRELGVMPAASITQAQQALGEHGLAFVPLPVIAPGLADMLALRARLGVRNSAHSLVKMLDPFRGEGVVMAAATHPDYIETMRDVLSRQGAHALLLRATEGEPFANPKRRPRIEYLREGVSEVLFEAEHDSLRSLPHLPEAADAAATACWMRKVIDGQLPIPQPIANQLAACLLASGYAADLNEAKAVVAVETGAHALAPA